MVRRSARLKVVQSNAEKETQKENGSESPSSSPRKKVKTAKKVIHKEVKNKKSVSKAKKTVVKCETLPAVKKVKTKSVKRTKVSKIKVEEDKNEMKSSKSPPKKHLKIGMKVREKQGINSSKFLGAHISAAGGIENAVFNAARIGAKSFALFTKSHRSWNFKPLEESSVESFRAAMKLYGYVPENVVAHGSYLMNCGSPNDETLKQSKACLVEEVKRCERLGIKYYNFHPGSTCGEITPMQSIERIAGVINSVIEVTSDVVILVENMSCQGSTVGGEFEHLRDILELVECKDRIGICFDTCHAFAAGFDLRTAKAFDNTLKEFDEIVGLKYLLAVHLNDSKGEVGCHLDRHEKIGKGKIGIESFRFLMNDERFDRIPIILETPVINKKDPSDEYEEEIGLMYSLES